MIALFFLYQYLGTMNYESFLPTSRDDLFRMTSSYFSERSYASLPPFTFYNSGMGSGKSNIIANIPKWLNHDGVAAIILPSWSLMDQMMNVLAPLETELNLYILSCDDTRIISRIQEALSKDLKPVVLFYGIQCRNGNRSRQLKLLNVILELPSLSKLLLIDEIDTVLTYITGGMNGKVDHSPSILDAYKKVADQKDTYQNLFDSIRKANAKCIVFTGTGNNLVCSKLPSLGYAHSNISILNVFPIRELYKDLKIVPTDFRDFKNFSDYFKRANETDGKVIIILASVKDIRIFRKRYYEHFGHDMPSVSIHGKNAKERATEDWKAKLAAAKYVIGINLVSIGFDIQTHCPGQQFRLGVLCRELSNKISQPLAKNSENPLHIEESAALLQALARLRDGGTFLVPIEVTISSLYDALVDVFEKIRDGRHEYLRVGPPRTTQKERCDQSILLGLMQNIRFKSENRPLVTEVLDELKLPHGRDFVAELKREKEQSTLDPDYWILAIGLVWDIFIMRKTSSITPKEKTSLAAEMRAKFRTRMEHKLTLALKTSVLPAVPKPSVLSMEPSVLTPKPSVLPAVPKPSVLTVEPSVLTVEPSVLPPKPSVLVVEPSVLTPKPSVLPAVPKPSVLPADPSVLPPKPSTASTSKRSVTKSGGSKGSVRIILESVKQDVIQRSGDRCGHCGDEFVESDSKQIAHHRRHDCGGSDTSDNLSYTHRACDSAYDEGWLVHDPDRATFWRMKRTAAYEPDVKQIRAITSDNIRHRWQWVKKYLTVPTASDDVFRNFLRERGYKRVAYGV